MKTIPPSASKDVSLKLADSTEVPVKPALNVWPARKLFSVEKIELLLLEIASLISVEILSLVS